MNTVQNRFRKASILPKMRTLLNTYLLSSGASNSLVL